jgi:iron-regulated transporter 1
MFKATSAILKSIDLITNIVAPIVTGQIMAFASTEVGALFIGGWNVVSVFLEYYLLWKVYNVVPALRAKKEKCRVEKGKHQNDLITKGK